MSRRVQIRSVLSVPMVLFLGTTLVRAELGCPQPIVDKGEVRSGLSLRHCFILRNCGRQPVEITDVRPSCGCLAPKLAKRIFQAGEAGELLLEVNTLTQPAGLHSWRITLRYRSGRAEQELSLYIRARIVTEITVEPPSLAIYTDTAIGHEITVTDRRAEPLIIRAVSPSSPYIRTHLGELSRDAAGRWRRTIRVEVTADCPEGTHAETLHIYTSDPLYTELKVPLAIVKHTRHQVSAAPASVLLSEPANQPLPARIVLLSAVDDSEVCIDHIEADHPAIDCRWAPGPGHQATLKIRVDRRQISGDRLRAAVHVHLSRPAAETLTIPVNCLLR